MDSKENVDTDVSVDIDIDAIHLLDKVYELALDPTQYENFLDSWEQQISTHFNRSTRKELLNVLDNHQLDHHLNRASQFLDLIKADTTDEQSVIIESIENQAAFLINEQLIITSRNQAAIQTFNINVGDPLAAVDITPSDQSNLEKYLQNAFRQQTAQTRLIVVRSAGSERTIIFNIKIQLDSLGQTNSAMIITTDIAWSVHLSRIIQRTFAFTESELEILKAMALGSTLKEISAKRNRSIDTIKTQIKSILRKTNTHSQQELIRITLGMMDIVSQQPLTMEGWNTSKKPDTQLLPHKYQRVQRQGRTIEYLTLGAKNGKPILFLPLEFGLIRWPASAEAFAEDNDLKIVVPIRAGYGNTSPFTSVDDVFNDTLLDMCAVLDAQQVDRCPIISNGSDSAYAIHIAGSCPERISSVYALAGVLPLYRNQQFKRLHKWHRFIIGNARFAPQFFPFVAKGGFKMARSQGPKQFFKTTYKESPADTRALKDKEIWDAMLTGSEVAFIDQPGSHKSFSLKILAQTRQWPTDPKDVKVPVTFINGHQDPQVPLETLVEHKEEFRNIRFVDFPDAGQLIFFEQWPKILDMIMTEQKLC